MKKAKTKSIETQRMTSRKRNQPTFSEFNKVRNGDVKVVRRFIEKYGVKARDPKEGGSVAHHAALNQDATVIEEVIEAGGNMLDFNTLGSTPLMLLAINDNGRVAEQAVAKMPYFSRLAHDDQRAFQQSLFQVGAATNSLVTLDAFLQNNAHSEYLFEGAVCNSNMKAVAYLYDALQLSQEKLADFMVTAVAQGREGHKAFMWLLNKFGPANVRAVLSAALLGEAISCDTPHHDTLVTLLELTANWPTRITHLNNRLLSKWSLMDSETLFFFALAGADMRVLKGRQVHFSSEPNISTVIQALAGEFAPPALEDPLVMAVWKEYSLTGLFLVRDRAAEVCMALQSLDLPLLQICEILEWVYSMWPGVPMHHYWNIGKVVQQRYRAKQSVLLEAAYARYEEERAPQRHFEAAFALATLQFAV